jgi:hypothetical protein
MGQILVIYMGLAVVVCHFFRKFCQDPQLEEGEEGDIEMKQNSAAPDAKKE